MLLGLAGLVLPGILVALGTASRTATASCATYTSFYAPTATSFHVRFELSGPSGIGWNCYAVGFGGDETLIAGLGVIPGGARLPVVPVERS